MQKRFIQHHRAKRTATNNGTCRRRCRPVAGRSARFASRSKFETHTHKCARASADRRPSCIVRRRSFGERRARDSSHARAASSLSKMRLRLRRNAPNSVVRLHRPPKAQKLAPSKCCDCRTGEPAISMGLRVFPHHLITLDYVFIKGTTFGLRRTNHQRAIGPSECATTIRGMSMAP